MQKTGRLKNWLVVIPARLASTRLNEKMLQDLGGIPLIVRVFENAKTLQSQGAMVLVATDSKKILIICAKHGVNAVLTSPEHQSGSDRVFEVAKIKGKPFILNIQGDEPFLDMKEVETLLAAFAEDKKADIGTFVYPSTDADDFKNPNVVKAVLGKHDYALYFSRAMIPYPREQTPDGSVRFLQHAGVYCYRFKALETFCQLGPSALEKIEKLEQLRALENGLRIKVCTMKTKPFGIDTAKDLEIAQSRYS